MIFKNSKISLILLSSVALVLVGLVVFDINNVRMKNEETSRLLLLADQASEEKAAVQGVRVARNNVTEEIAAFEDVALTDAKLVSTIETIESAGRRLGLATRIVSVEKSGEESGEPYQKVILLVETKGSWPGTHTFLKAMESLPNRADFDEMHLQKEGGVWNARIGISLYSFK
jgi:hypothetical protein